MTKTTSNLALVIGGSSGMGLATAQQLVENGIEVIIVGRSQQKLTKAQSLLSTIGKVETIQANLYDQQDILRLVKYIEDCPRHIEHFVNAAGYFKPTGFIQHSREDYKQYMDLNEASFFISQAVSKNMIKHGSGSIVHIGSMWAKQAVKATPSSAYSMAKAGLHALTQHMAMELADYNIRVNAVSPAVVKTPIYGSFIEPEAINDTLAGFDAFHPIGRIGQPTDIANVVTFLLSEKSSWVTGAVWDTDGGVMSGRN